MSKRMRFRNDTGLIDDVLEVFRDFPVPGHSSLALERLCDAFERALKRRGVTPAAPPTDAPALPTSEMSTLIEELGQAAERVDQLCRDSHPNRDKPCWHAAEASQYRARIAHIRELEAIAEAMTHNRVRLEAIRDVTGPIRDVTGPIPSTEEPKPPQTTCSHGIRFNLRCYACEPG